MNRARPRLIAASVERGAHHRGLRTSGEQRKEVLPEMPTHEEQHKQSRSTSADEEEIESLPAPQGSDSEVDDQTDAILDEIDAVLESNAEEFVQSFVQKGGA